MRARTLRIGSREAGVVQRPDDTVDKVRTLEMRELVRGALNQFRVPAAERRAPGILPRDLRSRHPGADGAERLERLFAASEAADRPHSAKTTAVGFDERLHRLVALALGLGGSGTPRTDRTRRRNTRPSAAHGRTVCRVLGDRFDDAPVRDLRKAHADEFDVVRFLQEVRHHSL